MKIEAAFRLAQILHIFGQNGNVYHILRNYLGNALLATSKYRKMG
jgi:hypothetical protein